MAEMLGLLREILTKAIDAIQGAPELKTKLRQRYNDYSSVLEQVESNPDVIEANKIKSEVDRLTELWTSVKDLIDEYTAAPGDGRAKKFNIHTKRGADLQKVNTKLDEIDADMMRQLAIMNLKGAVSLTSEMKTLLKNIMEILDRMRAMNNPLTSSPSYVEQTRVHEAVGGLDPKMPLAPHSAQVWERSMDQNGRYCWANQNSGQACYARLDNGGLPLPLFRGDFPFPGANSAMSMAVASMAMTPMGIMPMYMPSVAPAYSAATDSVAIVGDTVKEDRWSEYLDDDDTPFYHNPAKPEATTWEKPEAFGKQKNADKPVPPTKSKEKGPKYR